MVNPDEHPDSHADEHVNEHVGEQPWSYHSDIVGMNEIADRLGVGYHRVRRWNERHEATRCPRPIARLKTGPVWDMNDWLGWFSLWKLTRGSESWHRKSDKGGD